MAGRAGAGLLREDGSPPKEACAKRWAQGFARAFPCATWASSICRPAADTELTGGAAARLEALTRQVPTVFIHLTLDLMNNPLAQAQVIIEVVAIAACAE